jgi:hypothetical protein
MWPILQGTSCGSATEGNYGMQCVNGVLVPPGSASLKCVPGCSAGDTCVDGVCTPGGNTGLPVEGGTNPPVSGGSSGGGTVSLPNFVGVKTVGELISKIAAFLIKLATVLAGLALIWAGFQFVTAQGKEEAINKAKKNLIWTIAGIFVILASQIIISFVTEILGGSGAGQFTSFMNQIRTTLNNVIALLFVVVTVYFAWGVIQYVRSGGDEKMLEQGKKHMIWGIVGMAIMASSWGIVAIIANYLGGY